MGIEMDREILFRGKTISDDRWVYGDYCQSDFGEVTIHINAGRQSGLHRVVDPSTVGQYTGLRDAENKRIFDGDILLCENKHLVVWWNGEAFQWQAKEKQEVTCTFDGKKQAVVWDNIDLGWIAAEVPISGKMTTKVIGNIYDNPELLEVK